MQLGLCHHQSVIIATALLISWHAKVRPHRVMVVLQVVGYDVTRKRSIVGFFDVAARLRSGNGPITAVAGVLQRNEKQHTRHCSLISYWPRTRMRSLFVKAYHSVTKLKY